MSLYLILELLIILFPLILSFDKKMRFYRRWKSVFISIFLVGAVFVTWDIFFTRAGIWGFNPSYHASIVIFNLPLEEWLFFIVVPYACIFIHYSLEFVHPKLILSDNLTRGLAVIIILTFITIALIYTDKIYTFITSVVTAIVTGYAATGKMRILNRYFISFLIIIIPFLLFNGIWTGTFIKDEVFWYNDAYNLGIRVFSMPVEDLVYCFTLILLELLCLQKVESIIGLPAQVNVYNEDDDDD
jgi:lycopene cyclase domain-containing protein